MYTTPCSKKYEDSFHNKTYMHSGCHAEYIYSCILYALSYTMHDINLGIETSTNLCGCSGHMFSCMQDMFCIGTIYSACIVLYSVELWLNTWVTLTTFLCCLSCISVTKLEKLSLVTLVSEDLFSFIPGISTTNHATKELRACRCVRSKQQHTSKDFNNRGKHLNCTIYITAKKIGCFNHRVVTLVAVKL